MPRRAGLRPAAQSEKASSAGDTVLRIEAFDDDDDDDGPRDELEGLGDGAGGGEMMWTDGRGGTVGRGRQVDAVK